MKNMKNKKKIYSIAATLLAVSMIAVSVTGCSGKGGESQSTTAGTESTTTAADESTTAAGEESTTEANAETTSAASEESTTPASTETTVAASDAGSTVYEDMKAAFDEAGIFSANIGIFTKTQSGDSISYGNCGSGVIFEKKDGVYYALTAAHVVSTENAEFLVFTVNNEMKNESIPGFDDMNILSTDAYDAMYTAEVLYSSSRDDLAVIRFSTDEDLATVEIADADPKVGDRIMCIGNPENDWFAISYGTVDSEIESFGEFKGFPTYGMRHSAYIQTGSSGGAAINEEMKLVGITPGASLSLDGSTFDYGVLIPTSEIKICLDEWEKQQNETATK